MRNANNPYTPNAGATPEIIVGRDEYLEGFSTLLERLSAGRTDQSMIITGLRGVGKTVLLSEFGDLARKSDWQVVEFEARKHDDSSFRRTIATQLKSALLQLSPRARWTEIARRAAGAISAFALSVDETGTWSLSWDVEAAEGVADHGELGLDLTDALVAVGELAKERGRGVVLLIDEIQFLAAAQLEALIQAVHKTVQRKLPVALVGAGLPQIAELAGDAKSYAERLFKFPQIGALSPTDARKAIVDPAAGEGVRFEPEATQRIVDLTQGYPYFLQELCYQVWATAPQSPITGDDVETAREAYETKLDGSFFRVRVDRATPLQTAYMRAMAELGPEPQKAADVARLLNRESTQVAPTRAELIAMGLLYTPDHGYAAFTVPDFDKFLKRAIPVLEVPEIQTRKRKSK